MDSREITERPDSGKRVKLGRTHGILAVGAWAAREEIASLLEDGHPAEDIIRAIRSGEELGPSLRKESEVEIAPASEKEGKPFTSSGSVRSERSSLSADAPKWGQKAPSFSYSFRKRADPPKEEKSEVGSEYTPSDQSMNEVIVDEVETPFFTPQKEELKELAGGFRKKAAAPKRVAEFKEIRSELARYVPKSLPRRANPSEQKKLDDYDSRTKAIYEGLVVADISMDITNLVYDGREINDEKFKLYTEPRSGGTGLRYARMMERLLEFYWAKYGQEAKEPRVVGKDFLLQFLEHCISNNGYRTPKAMLYALDFYSVILGFEEPGSKWPRCKKIADDFASKAPPRNPAPFLDAPFLSFLEGCVVNEKMDIAERLTCGKLRLCAQASIRHDDLHNTPLSGTEWCRLRGSSAVVGLRAKASKTKTGPRPWVASYLGVDPRKDDWLTVTVQLALAAHGEIWKERPFFAPSFLDGDLPAAMPPSLEVDTLIIKKVLLREIDAGRSSPVTRQEALRFRWHGSKSSMPTFMGHLGIKAKVIRFQGAWAKRSDSMSDTYLREAQVIVLKGQVVVLERLRSGEKIGSLEGVGLTGERFGAESSKEEDGDEGKGPPRDRAAKAMDPAPPVLLRQGPSGEAEFVPELWQDVVMFPQELRDEGLAKVPTDEKTDYLAKEKEVELPEISDCVELAEKSDEEFEKIAAEDPAEDSEDSDASVEKHDMEVLDCLVTCGSRTKKVHRPAAGVANNPLQGNIPWCNASGKSFTILPLFEALPGDVSLCMRCFGKPGHCNGLCTYVTTRGGKKFRCARRCDLRCEEIGKKDADVRAHACSFHVGHIMEKDT